MLPLFGPGNGVDTPPSSRRMNPAPPTMSVLPSKAIAEGVLPGAARAVRFTETESTALAPKAAADVRKARRVGVGKSNVMMFQLS
jgi:hypothetical protein